jgi:excisionase family DNA binding protein
MTVNEIADEFKMRKTTVRTWITEQKLPASKMGRKYLIRRSAVLALIEGGGAEEAPPQAAASEEPVEFPRSAEHLNFDG